MIKKPYIKKFGDVSSFRIWIVDGKYIRDRIEKEFTNFGQHYRFKFIPEDELWVDRESKPGEEQIYIDSMIALVSWLKKGATYSEATKHADKIEKRERSKSEIIKKIKEKIKHKEEALKLIHLKLLKSYSRENIKVWIVDGRLVRDLFFIDFTEGGHGIVYPFIPKNEVWIDDDLNARERRFVLLHELYEKNLMLQGMNYENAHKKASEIESPCRLHPEELSEKLNKELKND